MQRSAQHRAAAGHHAGTAGARPSRCWWLALLGLALSDGVGQRNRPGAPASAAALASSETRTSGAKDVEQWLAPPRGRPAEMRFPFFLDFFDPATAAHPTARLDDSALRVLRQRFTGQRRFDELEAAWCAGELACRRFSRDQNLPSRSASGLAKIAISQRLAFRVVREDTADTRVLRLRVVEGGLRVNFGFAWRWLVGQLPDLQLVELRYEEVAVARQQAFVRELLEPDTSRAEFKALRQRVKGEARLVGSPAERRFGRRDLRYRQEGKSLVIALSSEAGVALPELRVTPPVIQPGCRPQPEVSFGKNPVAHHLPMTLLDDPETALAQGLVLRREAELWLTEDRPLGIVSLADLLELPAPAP